MADEVLENLKMWGADPLCIAAAKRIESDNAEIARLKELEEGWRPKLIRLCAENETLREVFELAYDCLPAAAVERVVHCWNDGPETADGCTTTCMLLDGHEGPHQWTRDDQIMIKFADGEV